MDNNLRVYEAVRVVPDTAKRAIQAGRLKGKTDINPMWRIKVLTERFGPCGIGWGYTIDRLWTEEGAAGEKCAFALIGLWYVENGVKSDPIPGLGGNMLVAKERSGPYTSDECYKMALTDAISVSAKALGVGADVYWGADGQTKYDKRPAPQSTQQPKVPSQPAQLPVPAPAPPIECDNCHEMIGTVLYNDKPYSPDKWCASTRKISEMNLCPDCFGEWKRSIEESDGSR